MKAIYSLKLFTLIVRVSTPCACLNALMAQSGGYTARPRKPAPSPTGTPDGGRTADQEHRCAGRLHPVIGGKIAV
jgi:hypothetical protein